MIAAGGGWISGRFCGTLRRGQSMVFDPKSLYEQLAAEGYFSVPVNKVRWLNTVSQRYCLAAALALRDAFENPEDLHRVSSETGIVSLSREGSLQSNLDYFRDYVRSGRKLARGNLFVHTLPTSPMAEAAITFGFKGPVFHLSAEVPKWNLLIDHVEILSGQSKNLNFLCCAANGDEVLCFFLKPGGEKAPGLFSLQEMKALLGERSVLNEMFNVLKVAVKKV